jgi:hypothetical protein
MYVIYVKQQTRSHQSRSISRHTVKFSKENYQRTINLVEHSTEDMGIAVDMPKLQALFQRQGSVQPA